MLYKVVLETDLDQHKKTLADATRELAEKSCVIEAQEYLLFSAKEEVQDLAKANAEKDQIISNLRFQIEQAGIENIGHEVGKKRKTISSV